MNERKVFNQEEPMTTPSTYVVRTGQIDGLEIKPFRDDLIKQAKDQGRSQFDRPRAIVHKVWLDAPPPWWPALAPLTKDERKKVIADLMEEADKKRTPPTTSTPL
jgi:polyhydroxyalkanoate synthesis regulator phasin